MADYDILSPRMTRNGHRSVRGGSSRARVLLPQGGDEAGQLDLRGDGQKDHGLAETRDSVAAKLKRGTFAATSLLACLAALELEGVCLEDL